MDGKIIYTHAGGLFYDYRRSIERFLNPHFSNEEWMIKEYWFVSIRLAHFAPVETDSKLTKLRKALFNYEQFYYDGHTVDSITLLGVTVSKGYSYDSRPYSKWEPHELS